MKDNLKVSLVEFDIEWESPKKNLEKLDQLLKDHQSDLVVLPEMFSTGFSMNPQAIAEPAFGDTFQWMKTKAIEGNCAVAGSISTFENGKFFNRFYFVSPDNTVIYDKKHLFGYGNETAVYSPGNEIINVDYLGWKFRLIVCYDLRFPVWCRNTDDYDTLICVASWPTTRIEIWNTLLKARAIENMAYVIGVNRIGIDGSNLIYNGNSKIFDAVGIQTESETIKNDLIQFELSKESLKNHREKYRFLDDRDSFQIQ